MNRKQTSLFEGSRRLQMDDSIDLTIRSLQAYGPSHKHWAIMWRKTRCMPTATG